MALKIAGPILAADLLSVEIGRVAHTAEKELSARFVAIERRFRYRHSREDNNGDELNDELFEHSIEAMDFGL